MTLYIILPFILIVLQLVFAMISQGLYIDKRAYLFFSFTLLFIIMSLRSIYVGTDVESYARFFHMIGVARLSVAISDIIVSAPVYCLLCRLIYRIVPDAQALTVVSAAIICTGFAFYFSHFSENVGMSVYCFVTLWFYYTSFNITRQYIAVSLILVAYVFADKRKWWLVILFGVLATGVHNTAAMAIPFTVLIHKKYSAKVLWVTVFVGLFSIIVLNYLFDYMTQLFAMIFPRYGMYFGSKMHKVTDEGKGDNIILTIYYLLFVLLAVVIVSKDLKNKKELNATSVTKLFPLAVTGVALGIIMASNLALGRIRVYFLVSLCCLIPNTLNRLRQKPIFIMICYAVMLVPYAICLTRNISEVVPYTTFFQLYR